MGIVAVQIVHDRIFGHQDLCRHLIVLRKYFLIRHHQSRLADGGARLLHRNVILAVLLIDILDMYRFLPGCDRAGAHQHHILSLIAQITQLPDQHFHADIVQISRLGMLQRGGSDLDYDPLFILNPLPNLFIHFFTLSSSYLPGANELQVLSLSVRHALPGNFDHYHSSGFANSDAMASATRIPSIAAEVMPPAYPAPSPQG